MSRPVRLPSISFVVARSYPAHVIGCENRLPWRLKADLQRFKKITLGHVVVMGRNTFDSIGRPLPGRVNIILSRRPSNDRENSIWNLQDTSLLWASSREDVIYLADILSLAADKKEFFMIGGDQMYQLFEDLGNRVHLTEVFTPMMREDGDAYFDKEFDGRKWKTLEEVEVPKGPDDEYPSRYTLYDRRIKTVRYVDLEDYYTYAIDRKVWVNEQLEKVSTSIRAGKIPVRLHQYHMFEEVDARNSD